MTVYEGFVAGRSIQLKLAGAVLAGGVKRYIFLAVRRGLRCHWQGSVQDLFDEWHDVRDLLRDLLRLTARSTTHRVGHHLDWHVHQLPV